MSYQYIPNSAGRRFGKVVDRRGHFICSCTRLNHFLGSPSAVARKEVRSTLSTQATRELPPLFGLQDETKQFIRFTFLPLGWSCIFHAAVWKYGTCWRPVICTVA